MSTRFGIFCLFFAPVFGFSLYLLVCTSSLHDSYQPGIGRIRWFSPIIVLVASFVIASLLARNSSEVVHFLQIALGLCAVIFVVVAVGRATRPVNPPTPPSERTLHSTIGFALAHPRFSNRSLGAPISHAVVIAILWLIHRARTKAQ